MWCRKGEMDGKMTKGRFAPSPTGRMHMGNVFSALLSWLSAKADGGEWLLRIEDIDPQRCKREYADQLMRDLEWLGLEWDEGPYYQSERGEIYEEHLARLMEMGIVYRCFCTRADIMATQAPHESDGRVVYKGTCRDNICTKVDDHEPAALRLMVPPYSHHARIDAPVLPEIWRDGHYGEYNVDIARQCGDFIVRRKDRAWAYQLAVVIDDALMGVTQVVRGRDLLLSSPQQAYVAELLGFPTPQFVHLPLLCNSAGQRLSKRDRSMDLGIMQQSMTAQEIIGRLAYYAGITPSPDPINAKNLIPLFSWDKVPTEDIIVS